MSYPYQRHKILKIFVLLGLCFVLVILYNAFSMGFASPVIPSDLTQVQYVNWRLNKCFYFTNNSQAYLLSGYSDDSSGIYRWQVNVYYEASLVSTHLYLSDGVEIYEYSFIKDSLYTGDVLYAYNGKIDLGLVL